ncbi:MAG: sugar phosphate isomerase/epimerase family protein [Kiritimatiellia bacterium]
MEKNTCCAVPSAGAGRRDFLAGGAAAGALLLAGCAPASEKPAETAMRARLGVCSWSFRLPLEGVAAEMAKMGLTRVHLALQPFLEGASRHGAAEGPAALERVKARLASGEWALSAVMVGFPQEDYSTLETIRKTGGVVPDGAWETNRKIVSAGAKLAAELKAPLLTLHAGFLDESDARAREKYADRVKFIIDACGEQGVAVAFETGQETADDLVRFLDRMPHAGVNFDPANMLLYGKGNPVEAVAKLAPWIRHVHIKDAIAAKTPGTWGTETPWGDGEVNPEAFFAALEKAGYTGNFAIEREGGCNRVADIAQAARRILNGRVDDCRGATKG